MSSHTRTPIEVLDDSSQLYEDKNDDYGDSWKLVGKILALILEHQDIDTLEIAANPDHLNALGLYTRRLDKLIRSFNATFVADELQVDESVPETVGDQVPYAAMHTSLVEEMAESGTEATTATRCEHTIDDSDDSTEDRTANCPIHDITSNEYHTEFHGGREARIFKCSEGHEWVEEHDVPSSGAGSP